MRGTFLESPRRENKNLADRPETRPDRAETGRVLRLIISYYVHLGRCNLLIFLQKKQGVFEARKTP